MQAEMMKQVLTTSMEHGEKAVSQTGQWLPNITLSTPKHSHT
jgi:hypothetical protein